MPLNYYLIPNHMTSDPDDYMAVSINPQSYDLDDVIEYMTREGSTITTAEAKANFEEISRGIQSLVRQGNAVNTPLVNMAPGMNGVFDGEDDRFDPARHGLGLHSNPGSDMRDLPSEIEVKKIQPTERRPVIRHYHDNTTEAQDELITPGRGARITGSLLKFDEEDEAQGVFFVNLDDHSVTRVDARMLKNKPGELIFLNPDLPAGNYRLEVRSNVEFTSTIRVGALTSQLTVTGGT